MSAHAIPAHQLATPRTVDSALVRVTTLAYGVVAYAAFLFTFLYAIGFVGNWVVPKSIDSGAATAAPVALAINAALLLAFALQHSVMARPAFKAWWTRFVPRPIERSTYVHLANAVLLLLFWQWRPLPGVVWDARGGVLGAALVALSIAGWCLVLASSFMVSHWDLFGLRQVWHRFVNRAYVPVGFRLVGVYRLVRHPLMVGFLIAFWATPLMTAGHLLFAVATTLYILVGTSVEERDLVREHGESYERYRRSTRGFVPIPRRGA